MIRMEIRTYFCALLLGAFLAGSCGVAEAAGPPTVDVLLERLGYEKEDKAALLEGKIIATDLKKTRDDQLIAAVAVQLNAPVATLAENVRKGRNIENDTATIAFGKLDPQGGAEQFAQARYDKGDSREIKSLVDVKSDGTFNLSKEEMAALKKALKGVKANAADAADKASAAYQEVLAGRFQAYVEKGLDGVANYEAGAKLEPAKELRAAYEQAKPFMDEFFPAFGEALGQFPAGQSPDISSDIFWIKRKVEGRPAFVLAHQMVQSGDDFLLLSQRQFFVGHTYESLQVVALAVPTEKGSAVFYVNSAYTDKVTGFFGGVAQSVGQNRTKDDLTKYFENIRKNFPQ